MVASLPLLFLHAGLAAFVSIAVAHCNHLLSERAVPARFPPLHSSVLKYASRVQGWGGGCLGTQQGAIELRAALSV